MSLVSCIASSLCRPVIRDGVVAAAVMSVCTLIAHTWPIFPWAASGPPGITFDEALVLANILTICAVGYAVRRVFEDRSRLLCDLMERDGAARATTRACTDPVTGIANRHLFDLECEEAVAAGQARTVLIAELRGLGRIETEHGRHEARQFLRVLARRLGTAVDSADLVARYDDAVFAVLTRAAADAERARETGDLVARALAQPVLIEGRRHAVLPAVGVTVLGGASDLAEAGRRLDHALATARALGRSAVTFCAPSDAGAVAQ